MDSVSPRDSLIEDIWIPTSPARAACCCLVPVRVTVVADWKALKTGRAGEVGEDSKRVQMSAIALQ